MKTDGASGRSIPSAQATPWSVIADLLVVDVDGTQIVVASWHGAHAPSELVSEVTHARDPISFVTGA